MILHGHEVEATRLDVREQLHSGRQWRQGKPATLSPLCASAQRRDRRTRSISSGYVLCRRPSRAPWGPAFEFQHDGGSSPAVVSAAGLPCPCQRGARRSSPGERPPFSSGSSAGVASGGYARRRNTAMDMHVGVRFGTPAVYPLSPDGPSVNRTTGLARHTHYHPSSRRADVRPSVVVFHAVAPSFATLRVQPPSMSRRVSRNRAFASAPLCSVVRNMEHNLGTPHPSSEDNHVSRRVC